MDFSRVAALATELASSLEAVEGVTAVYLFGSALGESEPSDVDLVVVYGPPLTPMTAPDLRAVIEDAVVEAMGLPAHLMFFTEREAREPDLLTKLEPRLLFGDEVS